MWRLAAAATVLGLGWGCGIIGPSCGGEKGSVFSLSGEVAPGAIVVHQVSYGTEGSQNDGEFTWTGQASADGPKPQLFITRVECEKFDPKGPDPASGCVLLDRAGWQDGHRVISYTITHGRGNPDTLGPTAQYKIWIVGDPDRTVQYTITAQWSRPVEC